MTSYFYFITLPYEYLNIFFGFLIFSFLFYKNCKLSISKSLFLFFFLSMQFCIILLTNLDYIKNFIASIFLLLPILLMCISNYSLINASDNLFQRNFFSLRRFIWFQISISLGILIYIYIQFGNFDVANSDYLAGTFSTFNPNSSANILYCYFLILLSFFYYCIFKKIDILLILLIFLIFISSVKHLLLISIISLGIAILLNRFNPRMILRVFILLFIIIFLYLMFAPNNLGQLVSFFSELFSSDRFLGNTKFEYFFNSLYLLKNDFLEVLFFGYGPGTYSSRVALQLSGLYSSELGIVSEQMFSNTYSLMLQLLKSPPYERGVLYQPYFGIFSLIFEYGILFTIFVIVSYKKFIYRCIKDKFAANFLFIFIILSNCVNNYFEYYSINVSIFIICVFLYKFYSSQKS